MSSQLCCQDGWHAGEQKTAWCIVKVNKSTRLRHDHQLLFANCCKGYLAHTHPQIACSHTKTAQVCIIPNSFVKTPQSICMNHCVNQLHFTVEWRKQQAETSCRHSEQTTLIQGMTRLHCRIRRACICCSSSICAYYRWKCPIMDCFANMNSVMACIMFQHSSVCHRIARQYVGILDLSTRW